MRLGEPLASKRNLTLLPLIDVIFLLLIFFMFSSSLSPFSMLPLTRDRDNAASSVPAAAQTPETPVVNIRKADIVILISANKVIRVNGKRVEAEDLRDTLEGHRLRGADVLVIAPSASASVQDLVGVLEAANRSAIPTVAIRQ